MKTNLSKLTFAAFLILFCVLFSNAQQTDNSNKSENKTGENAKNQDEAKKCPDTGVVRLKVTFDKSSKVTNIEMISSSGCKFYDKKALQAAKELKFNPAQKNGKNITQVKLVEFTFTKDG